MAAFPITPSTEIPQYFSKLVADGTIEQYIADAEALSDQAIE